MMSTPTTRMTATLKGGHIINRDKIIPSNKPSLTALSSAYYVMNSQVWVPSPTDGFIAGQIQDIHTETATVLVEERKKAVLKDIPYGSLYPAEDDPRHCHEDNCQLFYLNEATLLNNVRQRWERGDIYSYIANMLVALNPYKTLGIYNDAQITKYQGKSLGTLPPHVYAIADKAYRDMKTTKTSQSVIVSGESGAGKTESTKYILKFLCANTEKEAGGIEQKILHANPILEAFGNAKTTRNNNSSRFGKFIEIHFDEKWKVAGGYISHYLLEKSRIPSQASSERNYHIFYQLLSGLPPSELSKLGLQNNPTLYTYLKSGTCQFFGTGTNELRDPLLNDAMNFQQLQSSFANLNITATHEIYKIVSLVLHLGQLTFAEDEGSTKGGCCISAESATSLKFIADLAQLDPQDLKQALTNRVMQTAKGGTKGTVIQVPLKKHEAVNARDALAKAIYSRLFDWIVSAINAAIPFKSGSFKYIGVLDIAGFEYFVVNSFEQFCINYCNEKLQQFFNERVLRDEQELYAYEQLNVDKIEFVDNLDCIELIEGKGGILSLLDEEGKMPKGESKHFTTQVHDSFKNHFRLSHPRTSKIKEHRSILDDQGFIIRHFAGAVCYDTKTFLEKNNDALHFSLEALIQQSGNPFLTKLFEQVEYKGKLTFQSVAGKFKTQLNELLEKLREGGTCFVRCVKPNSKMVGGVFEGGLILSQLQCAGMTSVLELMQKGFPSRVHFASLYDQYKALLPANLSKLDPRFFCRALFKAVGLHENDFRFGLTRVFFRPGKFKEFDMLMRSDPQELLRMVERVQRWIVVSKWKRVMYTVWSTIKLKHKILLRRGALITIQKTVRMHLAKKRHGPRILATKKLRSLQGKIQQLKASAAKLKDKSCLSKVDEAERSIMTSMAEIKSQPKILKATLDKMVERAIQSVDLLVRKTADQQKEEKNREEMERAEKLRKEMEEAKQKERDREEMERREEEMREKKQQMEKTRRLEEEKMVKLESLAQSKLVAAKANQISEKQSEQEKRDVEMALRLASEGSTVEVELQQQLKRSEFVEKMKDKKHDLSGWKYSELRDCINTSCDVELLNACREEFHRRLKVYHAWKARNSQKSSATTQQQKTDDERAPKSIYQYQQSHRVLATTPTPPNTNRYFRVPFTKDGLTKGLWYAHFEGEYIQRQLEVGGSEVKVLRAGRDDMQMCELKLSETGLTRKRGAEILEYEFEKEWNKHFKE